jgi:hypothetical protein
MDDLTTAVTLVTLDQAELADQWFATITQTYDEVADADDVWSGFVDRFPGAADSYFGSSTAMAWVEAMQHLTSDPAGLLEQLAARRDELAALYWAELEQQQAAAAEDAGEVYEPAAEAEYVPVDEAATPDRFGWVYAQPELMARVEATLQYRPEHYESHLAPYLEQLWGPGWEQHPDEHKQAWLDQALAGLESSDQVTAADTEAAEPTQDAEAAQGDEAAELAEAEQQVAEALAEALAEVPEAAALSDEEIAEVLADVLAEQARGESV